MKPMNRPQTIALLLLSLWCIESVSAEPSAITQEIVEKPTLFEDLATVPNLPVTLKEYAADTMRHDIETELKKNNGRIKIASIVEKWKKVSLLMGGATMLLSLVPSSVINDIFLGLEFVNAEITNGPDAYDHSFILKGTTTLKGLTTKISMLYAPILPADKKDPNAQPRKGGISFSIQIPKSISLLNLFPGLKSTAQALLEDRRILICDFKHKELDINHTFDPGMYVVGIVDPKKLKVPENISKAVELKGDELVGILTVKPDIISSTFKAIIPPVLIGIRECSLGQLVAYTTVPMSKNIKNELDKIIIRNIGVSFEKNNEEEFFAIAGTAELFGVKNVVVAYKIFKAIDIFAKTAEERKVNKVVVNTVSFIFPDGWDITKTFPELKPILTMKISNPALTLVTQPYFDDVLEMNMDRGLHYFADVDLKSTGSAEVLKVLGMALGKQVRLHGVLKEPLYISQFDITIGKKRSSGINFSIGDLIPSEFPTIKRELSKAKFTIGEFKFTFGGIGLGGIGLGGSGGKSSGSQKYAIRLTGFSTLFGQIMPTDLHQLYIDGQWKTDMLFAIPDALKHIDPSFSALDKLSLPIPTIRIALIELPFYDHLNAIEYYKGLNIGGFLPFSGSLGFFKTLLPFKGLDGLYISGVLGSPIALSQLYATIPGSGFSLGKDMKMTDLKLGLSLGAGAFSIEGAILVPVPKEFRPKKGTQAQGSQSAQLVDLSFDIGGISSKELEQAAEQIPSILTQADTGTVQVTPPMRSTPVYAPGTVTKPVAPIAPSDVAEIVPPISEETTLEPFDIANAETLELPAEIFGNPSDADEDTSMYDLPVGVNNMMKLMGSIGIAGDSGRLACAMEGVVDIYGILLHEVGLQGQINLITGFPSGVGFRAMFDIGYGANPKKIEFAANIAAGIKSDFMWLGSYKGGLHLHDIVGIANKVIRRGPRVTQQFKDEFFNAMKKVPRLGVEEFSMAMVPFPTMIAGKAYEEGISIDARVVIFGLKASTAMRIDYGGIYGRGELDKIALPAESPQFIISSYDGNTGASFAIILGREGLNALASHCEIDGNIEIKPLGLKNAAKIALNALGGSFEIRNKPLYGLYEITLEGFMPLTDITSTRLKGTFSQQGLSNLSNTLYGASRNFINDANKGLDKIAQDVRKTFDQNIETQREIIRKEREEAHRNLIAAQQAAQAAIDREINKTKAEIARLDKKIKDKEGECRRAKWYRKADICLKVGFEITGYGTQLAAQKTYLEALLKPGRPVARETIGTAKVIIDTTPIDLDPRVSTLLAGKEVATTGISVGKISAQSLGELGKAIATLGNQAVSMKTISLETSLKDLSEGKMPLFNVEGVFLGQSLKLRNVQLDLKEVGTVVATFFDEIIDKIK